VPAVNLVVSTLDAGALSGVLGDQRVCEVVWFSLWQAVVSTAAPVVVGVWPAMVVARHRFRGRAVVIGGLTAVFVLPTVVLAAGVQVVLPGEWARGASAVIVAHVVFNLLTGTVALLLLPWIMAVQNRQKMSTLASLIAPYPTLSEVTKRTAGSYFTPSLFSERTRKVVRFLMKLI